MAITFFLIIFSLVSYCMDVPELSCFHHEWGLSLRTSNGSCLFQMILQIHIIYDVRINFVINPSKDWSFGHILAYLWSFLSISVFVSINFCNFAVKNYQTTFYGQKSGNHPYQLDWYYS